MGRGKIQIKRIDNETNRNVTFSKRKNGILKKTNEIATLCDCQVSLIIYSSSDKLVTYCSDNTTLEHVLEQYHDKKGSGERLWDAQHQDLSNQIEKLKKENDSIQLQLRNLRGEEIQHLQIEELGLLENTIGDGLDKIRQQKSEYFNVKKMEHKLLEDENEGLRFRLEQLENSNEYHQQTMRDCGTPFFYRVRPKHLHEGMY